MSENLIIKKLKSFIPGRALFHKTKEILSSPAVRSRLLFTLGILVLHRFLSNIPPAGIDIAAFNEVFAGNPLTNIFNVATGGRLDSPSLIMIGLSAYINASIIVQLLATVIPKLEEWSKEGESGQRILNQITRYLTIPLAIVQGWVLHILLTSSSTIISAQSTLDTVTFVASIAAGSLVLMWFGEQISTRGIGNGSSVLIGFGIISSLPRLASTDISGIEPVLISLFNGDITLGQALTSPGSISFLMFVFWLIIMIVLIVIINEAVRKILIQYARRITSSRANYLPIRLNQSGVMPIIFASSILTFPTVLAQIMVAVVEEGSRIYNIMTRINSSFLTDYNSIGNSVVYFVLIIAFSYFYAFVVQKPGNTADNLQKSGAFVPGIRPGQSTKKYLIEVMVRLTAVGSLFLAFIAVVPTFLRSVLIGDYVLSNFGLFSGIGGTSLLIVVSVLLSSYRQMQSLRVTKSYEQYR